MAGSLAESHWLHWMPGVLQPGLHRWDRLSKYGVLNNILGKCLSSDNSDLAMRKAEEKTKIGL